jgi:hypothetical protein
MNANGAHTFLEVDACHFAFYNKAHRKIDRQGALWDGTAYTIYHLRSALCAYRFRFALA